jgi:dTDP-glucose 4,6-dehydratase
MPSVAQNPLAADLDHVIEHAGDCLEQLRGARIFITGGTGFFGSWLLESLVWANLRLNLDAHATVLTREPSLFQKKAPHLAKAPGIELWEGDVRDFCPPRGQYDCIIHAATASSSNLNNEDPHLMWDTIVQGTRAVLDFAADSGCEEFLLTSSGAVYGPQPSNITHVTEDYLGGPDTLETTSAYAEGKRTAELLATIAHHNSGLNVKIARGFAFVGPYLPLDIHFAIGNFIRDALKGTPLKISGDGTPHRSYLYASDLVIWLWTILLKGRPAYAYNVGSEDSRSIYEIAQAVSAECGSPTIDVARKPDPGAAISRYVPSTQRAREELGLQERVPLASAISKTIAWHRQRG